MSANRCESCGTQPAPVRFTEIDAGRVTKKSLCRACAQKRGLLDDGPKPVVVLQEMLSAGASRKGAGRGTESDLACPGCGLTLAAFRQQGRLGCARCYTTFHATLTPLLRRLHGAARHTGKSPRADARVTELRRRVEMLRSELDRAVRGEEYEHAARLRDELRAVEAEQSATAGGGVTPDAADRGGAA